MKMNFYKNTSYLLVFGLLIFASCLRNVEEEEIIEDPIGEEVVISFKTDVKPLIDDNCASCHGPNTPNLTTLSNVMANAAIVKEQVVTRQMPIGKTLTAEEINTIVGWIDAGALDN